MTKAELPVGWVRIPLHDVCEIASGGTPKTTVDRYWGDELPWITPADMAKDRSQILHRGRRGITAEGLESSAARLLPPGTVIFSSRAPIGYVAVAGTTMATNQGCKNALPSAAIDPHYLYWYLIYATPSIENRASGTTFKEISRKGFGETEILLPPLAEQRRIVTALDDHLSRLDAARAYIAAALAKNTALWRAVLDQQIADASAEWGEQRIGEVAEVQGGILKNPKRRPTLHKYPFLRVANVLRGGLDLVDVHEVELFDGELERYGLKFGDLLVVEGNGSPDQIGRAAMWRETIKDCVHQNHLIRVRPGPHMDPEYLEFAWNSPLIAARLRAVASTTTGLHTLSTSKVKSIHVPIPPLAEQRRHVLAMRDWQGRTARLAAANSALQRKSLALRRSLLCAAFTGKLVPQDFSDEPATVLLEQIRAEQPSTKPKRIGRSTVWPAPKTTSKIPTGTQEELPL